MATYRCVCLKIKNYKLHYLESAELRKNYAKIMRSTLLPFYRISSAFSRLASQVWRPLRPPSRSLARTPRRWVRRCQLISSPTPQLHPFPSLQLLLSFLLLHRPRPPCLLTATCYYRRRRTAPPRSLIPLQRAQQRVRSSRVNRLVDPPLPSSLLHSRLPCGASSRMEEVVVEEVDQWALEEITLVSAIHGMAVQTQS